MFLRHFRWIAFVLFLQLLSCHIAHGTGILGHYKLDKDAWKESKHRLGSAVSSFLSGEFIIELSENTTDVRSTVENMMVGSGGKIIFVYDKLFKGAAISDMSDFSILKILDHISVIRASRNAIMTLVALPSEVDQQNAVWGIDRITPPLDGIYSYQYDGTGVTAFIFDTGLRTTHSEFKNGRASCGFSAYNDNCNDANGHGTHVAGTVGGITYGIAKNVNLVSVKVCGVESCQKSYILAGLDYVFGQKQANPSTPMVINLSLGGPKDSLFNDKISKTIKAGVTTVVAAGNEGANACDVSPASAKAAITVGATDKNDALASSSNRGPCVDVLAPGSSITSAWSNSNSGVNTISGTSMAAPHVTGLAVLHLSKDPSLTPTQVLKAIRTDALRNVVRIRRKILFPVLNETPNLLVTAKSLLQ